MTRIIYPGTWSSTALEALHRLAREKQYLTVDNLHDALDQEPDHHNSYGAVFDAARQMGLIIDTGAMIHTKRGPAKGRKVTLWESAYHRNPNYRDPDPVTAYRRQEGEPMQEGLL